MRAKNERTAKNWTIEILGKEKKGRPLKNLANQMLESRYKTTSTNFSMALYQVLHNATNTGETFDVDAKTGKCGDVTHSVVLAEFLLANVIATKHSELMEKRRSLSDRSATLSRIVIAAGSGWAK